MNDSLSKHWSGLLKSLIEQQIEGDRLAAEQRLKGVVFDASQPSDSILASAQCVAQLYPRLVVEVATLGREDTGISLKVIVWAHGSPPVPFFSESVGIAAGETEIAVREQALRVSAQVMKRCTDPWIR